MPTSFKSFLQTDLVESYDEFFLTESRIDFLKNQFKDSLSTAHDQYAKHKKPEDIVDHFATHADPSPNKKYTSYILNQYKKGHIRQEDAEGVHQTLQDFERVRPALEKKDINQYGKISDLRDAVREKSGQEKGVGKSLEHPGNTIIHNTPAMEVAKINTFEGSAHCADGTDWCTRHEGNYNHYKKDLVAFRDKKTGEKFQIHPGSNQIMNQKDEPVSINHIVNRDPSMRQNPELKKLHPGFNTDEENYEILTKHNPSHEWKSLLIGTLED